MNKFLKGLLVAVTAFGCASASDSNNKTHYNTRVCRTTVPAYTTFHEMKSEKRDESFGGNVEVTGFYGRSTNGSHLAKNFGAHGGTSIQVLADAAAYPSLKTYNNQGQVWNELLLHDASDLGNALAGIMRFHPRQTVYGARLDYFQRFDKWLEGLWFGLNVAVARVTNDLNLRVDNAVNQANTTGTPVTASEDIALHQLFTGKCEIKRLFDADKQEPLKYAKMCSNSKTGLEDIEAYIGWRFLEAAKYHAGVNLTAIFPTATKANPEFLWGARTGESKWGLGIGADGSAVLWEEGDQNFKVIGNFQYKYLFDGTEKRTLGLKELRYLSAVNTRDTVINPLLSQYYLVGKQGVAGIQPLANVSTINVTVKPGSQIDAILAFAYNNGGFTLDFGYNFFWKEAERIRIKGVSNNPCGDCGTAKVNCEPCPEWTENTYAVVEQLYDPTGVFDADSADSIAGDRTSFIKATNLDTKKAETPAQIVHKPFIGVGYTAKTWEYPVMVGAGVAYEIPSSNRDSAEGYSFWAKAGVAF